MIYGYLRVSTDDQDCDNQKRGVLGLAEQRGLTVDKWIVDDGISGTVEPEKRAFGKLMKKLKAGDIILASELTRLGRKLFMVMRILEFCMNNNIKVITQKDGYELGDNIQSKVLAFAFGLAGEIERNLISQRTKEALAKRKAEGKILGRPLGTKNTEYKLTHKEYKITDFLRQGFSYCQIARTLKVHRITVRNFVHSKPELLNIYNKHHNKTEHSWALMCI